MTPEEFEALLDEVARVIEGQMAADMAVGLYVDPDHVDFMKLSSAARSLVDELDYYFRLEKLERRPNPADEIHARSKAWGQLELPK